MLTLAASLICFVADRSSALRGLHQQGGQAARPPQVSCLLLLLIPPVKIEYRSILNRIPHNPVELVCVVHFQYLCRHKFLLKLSNDFVRGGNEPENCAQNPPSDTKSNLQL